jgi:hypothetical protein
MGDNIVNFYAGQPPLNRLSWVRPSAESLNGHLHNDKARFIAFKYDLSAASALQANTDNTETLSPW